MNNQAQMKPEMTTAPQQTQVQPRPIPSNSQDSLLEELRKNPEYRTFVWWYINRNLLFRLQICGRNILQILNA